MAVDLDTLLAQALRMALPLVLAAVAETVAERGGVVNLGIEGMMIVGAFVAHLVAAGADTSSLFASWAVASACGAALGALLALFTVRLTGDAIVAGTGIHLLSFGATGFWFSRAPRPERVITFLDRPGALSWFPFLATAAIVLAVTCLFRFTRAGLLIRASGEDPVALRAVGGNPGLWRTVALLIAGALSALAGATLTTVLTGEFVEGMSGGRGFLALSLVILGRWSALGASLAALFLGLCFTIEIQISSIVAASRETPLTEALVLLLRSLPYALPVLILGFSSRRLLRAPRALGQ